MKKHSATEVASYELTNRPLGITDEVAEYEAIGLLHLEPAQVRQPGYYAVRRVTSCVKYSSE